jgi:hypothetical protein
MNGHTAVCGDSVNVLWETINVTKTKHKLLEASKKVGLR